ncbi:zinc finger protein 664 isoform X1 [Drosophila bipectinata]|uniref:zinc finger protein 664 isoform X1 n=1 Tax=Drosophila bipectinata TaxID=42026 RepID=UPI001C8966B5|nr:zinc finger protein 184 [Drosophila bipectinata]
MEDLCRTCSGKSDPETARNLFDTSSTLLKHIYTLTNMVLKDDVDFPRFICQQCQHDLQIAIDFRRVCLEAQELLQLKKKKVDDSGLEAWIEEEEDSLTTTSHITNHTQKSPSPTYHTEDELGVGQREADFLNGRQASATEQISVVLVEELDDKDSAVLDENQEVSNSVELQSIICESIIDNSEDFESIDICCSNCGLSFGSLEELRTHKYQLHDVSFDTRFVCDHCGEGFRSVSGLTRHCNVVNLPLTHKCVKCPLKFPNTILLECHEERCNAPVDARLVCHICGKQLASTSNLKNHLVRHMGTRSHKCSVCDASFAIASELTVHMKCHSLERPYTCRYDCGKTFRYCSARSIHERIHMDESKRPYRCEFCPKAFVTPSDCRSHQKYHTLSRNFSCEPCRMHFKLMRHYNLHIKSNTHKAVVMRVKAQKQ